MCYTSAFAGEAKWYGFGRGVNGTGVFRAGGDGDKERVTGASHGTRNRAAVAATKGAFDSATTGSGDCAGDGAALERNIGSNVYGIPFERVGARGGDSAFFGLGFIELAYETRKDVRLTLAIFKIIFQTLVGSEGQDDQNHDYDPCTAQFAHTDIESEWWIKVNMDM